MKTSNQLLFLGFLLIVLTKLASAQTAYNEVDKEADYLALLSKPDLKIQSTETVPGDTEKYVLVVDAHAHLANKEKEEPIMPLVVNDKNALRRLNLMTVLSTLMFEHPILFNYNDYRLTENAKYSLDLAVMIITSNSDAVFEIGGHADARGLYDDNLILTEKRVNAVVDYLLSKGVSSNQLITFAYGESVLKNVCDSDSFCSEEVHATNRRVEIKLVSIGK